MQYTSHCHNDVWPDVAQAVEEARNTPSVGLFEKVFTFMAGSTLRAEKSVSVHRENEQNHVQPQSRRTASGLAAPRLCCTMGEDIDR